MARILVLWSDDTSLNLGVRALSAGSSILARKVWPGCSVDKQDFEAGDSEVAFNRESFKRDIRGFRGPIKTKLRGYDVILDTGAGDSFTDIYGLKRLILLSYVRFLASRGNRQIVMLPQTIGPFNSRIGTVIARWYLKKADLVFARDAASEAAALSLDCKVDLIGTDLVFGLEVPSVSKTRDVILNISGLLSSSNPHVDHVEYLNYVEQLITELSARGRRVSLLAHVLDSDNLDNDVPIVRALAARHGLEYIIPSDLDDARAMLASARLVIGSRMHACLNALSVGVPVIPWAYSRKFAPLFAQFGWAQIVDIRHGNPIPSTMKFMDQLEGTSEKAATVANSQKAILDEVARAIRDKLT